MPASGFTSVPGPFNSPTSTGCNRLIREGGTLVTDGTDGTDIFAALGDQESGVDRLIDATGLPSQVVTATLMKLEMRMPSHRISPCLCLRLLEQALAVAFAGFLLATIMSAGSNHPARGVMIWAIITILILAGLVAAARLQCSLGRKWRRELPIGPPAPDFS